MVFAAQKHNKYNNDWSTLLVAKKLDLFNCGLSRLPNQIGSLVQLTSLNIGYNKLSDLPSSIGNLTNLEKIFLNDNNL